MRRQARRLHAEFLQSIGKGKGQVYVRERVIIVRAIHQVVGVGGLRARDRVSNGAGVVFRPHKVAGRRDLRSGCEQNKLRGLAAVQRQVHGPLPVDYLGDGLIFCLHHRGGGCDLDGLRHSADLQLDVETQVVAHLDDNAGLLIGAKA